MISNRRSALVFSILIGLALLGAAGPAAASPSKKPLTFLDVMKFRAVQESALSENGEWIAFAAQPDRGDGEVQVKTVKGDKVYVLERGGRPVFSKDGRRLAAVIKPRAADMEKPAKDRPKPGLGILDLESGRIETIEKVERFVFSDDGLWLAYGLFKEEAKNEPKDKEKTSTPPPAKEKEAPAEPFSEPGNTHILRNLAAGREIRLENAASLTFDPTSSFLAYALAAPDGKANGLYVRNLKAENTPEILVLAKENGTFASLSWPKALAKLAFLAGTKKDKDDAGTAELHLWDGATRNLTAAVSAANLPAGWMLPLKSTLSWTQDGKRLFLGLKPVKAAPPEAVKEEKSPDPSAVDLFNFAKILEKREVDVWHWNDPLINSQQKKAWPREKDLTYTAVYHLDAKKLVRLGDEDLSQVVTNENAAVALGLTDKPYLKEITWEGDFADVSIVDLATGARRKVLSRLDGRPSLSPNGKFIAFFKDKDWHLIDVKTGSSRNLTEGMKVAFFDEDDDNPAPAPAYGLAGWMEDDGALYLYDRFDVWAFPTAAGGGTGPVNITAGEGRAASRTFRVLRLEPEQRGFQKGQEFLLSSYHNQDKNSGFYACQLGKPGVEVRLEEKKKFTFVAKAKKAGTIIFSREDFGEFPDLWTASDARLLSPRKLTDVNPQIAEFAWGTAELVDWTSADGIPLQGVLIKPGDYEPGKRYPVFVYYYELSSQRLYEFNQIVVNHRPCFPVYASHGYALFLPDIRFEVGRPGLSAVKCLVPGVQKLIDMGIADPKAIGLHGHSWSGYETAFVVTQTDIFAAAIAGAPVGNMTSAYSGIRWESGMARQFQYEQSQSRIGASLWQARDRYIENSPVFYADRIKTPLLLMHGDEDGAVPWSQSIEIYLAMRRLGKDCIFLQYRGEPHHPQKYPNKLDYSIRMMEYFDHYLKGAPAANWIKNGIPYNGK